MDAIDAAKLAAEALEAEQRRKDTEEFNNGVRSINSNFNDAFYQMKEVANLISESFVLNGEKFDNEKINTLLGSIK